MSTDDRSTRLHVEEGGQRRVFRMGTGILTLGSGAGARLRLESPGVADVHADLELTAAGVVHLRTRPGVRPPTVDGAPVEDEAVVAPGQVVELGGARLWIEGAVATEPAPRASAPAAAAAVPQRPRSVVQRTRPRVKRGLPGWAIGGGVIAVAAVAFLFLKKGLEKVGDSGLNPIPATVLAVERHLEEGQLETAKLKLAAVPVERASPAQLARLEELREQVEARLAQANVAVEHNVGTKYLEVYLKRYAKRYLAGDPEPSKARLFLERCQEFRRRWPEHPDLDWVERQAARLEGVVDLSQPRTFEDVKWKVKLMVDGMPRDYEEAFALIDDVRPRTSGAERDELEDLRSRLVIERHEYHKDRLYQARFEWEENKDPQKSVWWLMHSVANLGDPAMEDEAARFLIKIPDLEGHLRAYERDWPDLYAEVVGNGVVKAWAKQAGFRP